MSDFILEVRDVTLARIGQVADAHVAAFSASVKWSSVGSWSLTVPGGIPAVETLSRPGSGVVATWRGETVLSGPMVKAVRKYEPGNDVDEWTFTGVDDNHVLADALAFPNPVQSFTAQSRDYDVRPVTNLAATVEDVMREYVEANIGALAQPDRRLDGFLVESSLRRGPACPRTSARFEKLGELLAGMGAPHGLGFRVRQEGNVRRFEITQGRDLGVSVQFSVANGTAEGYEYTFGAPSLTRALVAGGEVGSRVNRERATTDSLSAEDTWGRRIESYVDKDGAADLGELNQSGDEALAAGGSTVIGASVTPIDAEHAAFAVDWELGDVATVVFPDLTSPDGKPVYSAGRIEQVDMTYGAEGFLASAVVGDPTVASASALRQIVAALQTTSRRIGRLERKR